MTNKRFRSNSYGYQLDDTDTLSNKVGVVNLQLAANVASLNTIINATKNIPIDFASVGGVGDGATDNYAMYQNVLALNHTDVTSRLLHPTMSVDSDSNGRADNWTLYQDGTVTGTLAMNSGAQQMTVTASTGAGGIAVYQDFTVTPGETIQVGLDYYSTVTSGTFIPEVLVYNSTGASIKAFTLPNKSSFVTDTTSVFTVPAGVISIRLYFMARAQVSGDAGIMYVKNITLATLGDMTKKVLKFPQNTAGNATYYFSSNPDLTQIQIAADPGVILSVPSTNGLSFKKVTFLNDVSITSRDRNNTGKQLANNYSKLLYTMLSDNALEIGAKKPRYMADSEFSKIAYYTNGTATTAETLSSYDSTRNMYKISNTGQANNAGKLNVIDFAFKPGYLYTSLISMIATETSSSSRYGVTFAQDSGNFLYYSIDINGNLFKGTTIGGAWTETHSSKYTASNLTAAYNLTRPVVFGARAVNQNSIEIYLNGTLVETVTVSFNATRMGFGINTIVGTSVGVNNLVWGQVTETQVTKANIGDVVNCAVFGDSITFGEGAYSWAEFLPQILEGYRGIIKFNVDNQSVSGQKSADQLSIMNSYNFAGKDIVLILIGTNDIAGSISVSTFQTNLQSMITKAQANGAKVVIGIPPMWISQGITGTGFSTSNYDYGANIRNMIIQVVAQGTNVYLADTMSEVGRVGLDTALTTLRDNLHPNAFGQALLARAFARSIVTALTNDYTPNGYTPMTPVVYAPTLLNGWVNYGSGYDNAGYFKTSENIVKLSGLIKSGTITAGTPIFTLPIGFRPAAYKLFVCATNGGTAAVEVHQDGSVICSTGVNATFLSLETVQFVAVN